MNISDQAAPAPVTSVASAPDQAGLHGITLGNAGHGNLGAMRRAVVGRGHIHWQQPRFRLHIQSRLAYPDVLLDRIVAALGSSTLIPTSKSRRHSRSRRPQSGSQWVPKTAVSLLTKRSTTAFGRKGLAVVDRRIGRSGHNKLGRQNPRGRHRRYPRATALARNGSANRADIRDILGEGQRVILVLRQRLVAVFDGRLLLLSKAVVSNVVQTLNGEAFRGHRFRSYLENAFFLRRRHSYQPQRHSTTRVTICIQRKRADFRDGIRRRHARRDHPRRSQRRSRHNNITREERACRRRPRSSARRLDGHLTRKESCSYARNHPCSCQHPKPSRKHQPRSRSSASPSKASGCAYSRDP